MLAISIKEYVSEQKEGIKRSLLDMPTPPHLAIVQVGENPASNSYVRGKLRDAEEVGIKATLFHYPEDIGESALKDEVIKISRRDDIDGVIVQLPLPKHIKEQDITRLVPLHKDVDGFLPDSPFVPCTPKGIVDYLGHIGFEFQGHSALVIGRSNIVGKPLAKLLLSKNMTVTVAHSKTTHEDMDFYIGHADLVCIAVGREGMLDGSFHYNPGSVIVDVGINRGADGHLHGDALPGLPVALQTPVPGGVGLLTRLSLLKNVLEAKN